MNEANLNRLATAEAKVLAEYFEIEEKEPEQEWYWVRVAWNKPTSQVGAYRVYENAVDGCHGGYGVYNNEGAELFRRRAEYVVKAGDTLGKLASKYDVTVDSIIQENQKKYPKIIADYIQVGWKLVIM